MGVTTPSEALAQPHPVTVCPVCAELYFDPVVTHCTKDGAYLVASGESSTRIDRVVGGRYRLLGELGEGGMGKVYLAEHGLSGRRCALKIIRSELESSKIARERFLRECQMLERIDSPHVVQVLESGASPAGEIFLVMELLEGRDLSDRIEDGPLSIIETAQIGAQIASALSAAHAQSIVHRDLKPENVFLCSGGNVKVLDFGIARLHDAPIVDPSSKLTATGTIVGTPAYMSPETVQGTTVGPASDLYSLGVILYEMIAGHAPFRDEQRVVVMTMHLTSEPPPLPRMVPQALEELVFALLEKDPEARPKSAEAVKSALEAIAASAPTIVEKRIAPPKRRRWLPFAAVGVALLGIAIGAGIFGAWLALNEPDAPAPARAPEPPPRAEIVPEPPPPEPVIPPPEPVIAVPEAAAEEERAPEPPPPPRRARRRRPVMEVRTRW